MPAPDRDAFRHAPNAAPRPILTAGLDEHADPLGTVLRGLLPAAESEGGCDAVRGQGGTSV
jgi:hypothetical protein